MYLLVGPVLIYDFQCVRKLLIYFEAFSNLRVTFKVILLSIYINVTFKILYLLMLLKQKHKLSVSLSQLCHT